MTSKWARRSLRSSQSCRSRDRSFSLVAAAFFLMGLSGIARAQSCPTADCMGNDANCIDGLFCTLDFCIATSCLCIPNNCDDGLFCTEDTCNEGASACEHTPTNCPAMTPHCNDTLNECVECLDAGHCTTPPRLRCSAQGACVECTNSAQCQDLSFCNGQESCNFSTGLCEAGTPPTCPRACFKGSTPGATCTSDADCGAGGRCPGFCFMGPTPGVSCSTDADCGAGGECGNCSDLRDACVQCENVSHCSNALYCDGPEACSNDLCADAADPDCRECVGGTTPGAACASDGDCDGGGTCPTTGAVSYCDEANDRCQSCLSDGHCDDGLFCTADDCTHLGSLNVCNNTPDPWQFCDDRVFCNGAEQCNTLNTGCTDPPDVTCQKTCFLGPAPGSNCTSDVNCGTGGKCLGFCSENFGGCVQCEVNATCVDGLFCNGTETCNANGQCVAGTAPNCVPFGTPPCSEGTCNETTDQCVATPTNPGAVCDDNNHCTASTRCSSGLCVDDPPTASDPFRCIRLQWQPETPQNVTVGSTAMLTLYAVADGCNTASADCPANQHPVLGIEALVSWDETKLGLQASTAQDLNPQESCGSPNSCVQCQTCTGGTNPGKACYQQCIGGVNHGQLCFNGTQCPNGVCSSGPVCSGGTNAGNSCTINANCPGGGVCFSGPACVGGSNNGNACTTDSNCPNGGTCAGKCLGGGACAAPTTFNWDSNLFPNDCDSGAMNGPCPSLGFPGNDGDLYYQSIQPLTCFGAGARPACIPPAGLPVTTIKFKVLPGTPLGMTNVSLLSCGPFPRTPTVQSALLPPAGYTTDNALKSLGPAAIVNVVACAGTEECDDGNPCTIDSCLNGACSHRAVVCNDANACTEDACVNGSCTFTPVSCGAGEVCYLGDCYTPCSTVGQCDDGVACTDDSCDTSPPSPIDGICRHTPNDDLCDTGLFCSADVCDAELGCVFDHPCYPVDGNPCPVPSTCDETTDTCGGCRAPTAVGGGPRYLLVTPDPAQGTTPVALRVKGECGDTQSACVDRFVRSICSGGPNNGLDCITDTDCPSRCVGGLNPGAVCMTESDCPLGACEGKCDAGTLGGTPFYKTAAQWGTAKVRGPQIRPAADYLVETACNFPGVVFSAAAKARTSVWGDVDGNGVVNSIDVANEVNAFRGFFGTLTFEALNLYGCTPDGVINALDITFCVDANKELAFPCAIVCP